jgi:hypothetical protein
MEIYNTIFGNVPVREVARLADHIRIIHLERERSDLSTLIGNHVEG